MRRGLTLARIDFKSFWMGRRNEFPDERGIDTRESVSTESEGWRRNEFPDEKGIDTLCNCQYWIMQSLRRNEFPDEKGIDTLKSLFSFLLQPV